MQDEVYMQRCLSLASQGRGKVGNGALVGAILVRDGKIVAEAFHEGFGKAHAEAALLTSFDAIENDDVLYVNLEPCCHQGKTPPCTNNIIKSGVKHVVFGMLDPDERNAGKGIQTLREAGIEIRGPILRQQCVRLNRGFISVRRNGRPWITLKKAQTVDGKISNDDGSKLCITSEKQNHWAHNYLRARHDAILIGVKTVISDNPILNIRVPAPQSGAVQDMARFLPRTTPQSGVGAWGVQNSPLLYRLILDSSLKISLEATVVNDDNPQTTILITSMDRESEKEKILTDSGIKIMHVPLEGAFFDFAVLWNVLTTPQENFHGITSILVEGGPITWEYFKKAGVVDEEIILVGYASC